RQGQMAESVVTRSSSVASLPPPAPLPAPRPPNQGVDFRSDFRTLVFWLGSVTTAADGRASVSVTLPDSLTTYRIMAVAGDLESRFGAGSAEIRATKLLTLLTSFPRFLSRDDRASFGAIVTNSTGRSGDAVVTIRSVDPVMLDFG